MDSVRSVERMPNMKYLFDDGVDENGYPKHCHTLDGRPLIGTSTAVNVLAKPLSWWAAGKAVETLGWIHPDIKDDGKVIGKRTKEERVMAVAETLRSIKIMTADAFVKLLDRAYKAHSVSLKDSSEKGTDLHQELEDFVKSEMGKKPKRDFDPKIQPFIDWSKKNVEKFIYSEAHCFSERLWTGGISDAAALLKDGSMAIIDFKSSKEAYISQFIQCAGYAIQIEENGLWDKNGTVSKKIDKTFDTLIVVPFGAKEVVPKVRKDIKELKQGFESAVYLYKLTNL